jgi:hypothetical protein
MKFDLTQIMLHFHSMLITTITAVSIALSRIRQECIETSACNGVIPDDIIEEMVRDKIEQYNLSKVLGIKDGDGNSPPPAKRRKLKYDRARAHMCVFNDYMSPTPLFDDKQFERVF